MKRLLWLVVAVLVVAIGLSFAMLNPQDVELDFYLGRMPLPISLWLVMAFALGAVVGMAAALGVIMRQRWRIARLQREAEAARSELSELRKLPIRNSL